MIAPEPINTDGAFADWNLLLRDSCWRWLQAHSLLLMGRTCSALPAAIAPASASATALFLSTIPQLFRKKN